MSEQNDIPTSSSTPANKVQGVSSDVTSMPFFQSTSLVGVQIDTWRLEALLGEGGMSAVYLAKHMWLQQEAAVKVLLPEYCRDVDVLARFQQEALAVSRLEHPNIIEVKDFGVDPNHGFFMVLEYLKGQDLESVMSSAPFPKSWILHIFEKVCRGLHLTHEEGIVHRDLKPSNLFLLPGESLPAVKILDFGVAKVQFQDSEQAASKLTKTGIVVGTPAYLAPEQISPQGETTRVSDIYALGVILYQCLAGVLPLEADSPVGFLLKVLQQEPPPLGEHRPELAGSALEALVASMLHKSPFKRPQTTEEVWKQLKDAAQSFDDPNDLPEHYPEVQFSEPKKRERKIGSFAFDETGAGILPTGSDGTWTELRGRSSPVEPTGSNIVPIAIAAIVVLVLTIGGILGYRLMKKEPVAKGKTRVVARAATPKRSLLDDLIIKGRKALKQKKYLAAARIWKRALAQKGAKKSRQYARLYRAIGYAYREKNWLHSAVHYFNKYKQLVQEQQEQVKKLRQKMAAVKADPTKRKQLDLALQKLLARLPKAEQFEKDFRNLSSLRSGLQERASTGAKLLATFRKYWQKGRWEDSRKSLQSLNEAAPSVPSLHLEVARTLATPFLAHALSVLRRIKRDMSPSPPQQAAVAALEKKLKERQSSLQKEWRGILAEVSSLLKANQLRKAMSLLRKLLKQPEKLAEASLHALWRDWLKKQSQATPRQIRPAWRLYANAVGKLKKKGLWGWLQANDKGALSAGKIRKMLKWLGRIERARKLFASADQQFRKGRLRAARAGLRSFLKQSVIPKESDPWELATQINQQRAKAKAMLAVLERSVPLQRELQKAHYAAMFVDAEKHREALRQALKGTSAAAAFDKVFEKQKKRQEAAEKILSLGHTAFGGYRWKPARKHYRTFLKWFPRASIKPSLDKRLKTCRCALQIYPWETCDKLKIPKRSRR